LPANTRRRAEENAAALERLMVSIATATASLPVLGGGPSAVTERTRPTSRPTFSMASKARARCSLVWVAIREVRINARPGGVAGDRTQFTNTPSS
jgi:hypothetical protein